MLHKQWVRRAWCQQQHCCSSSSVQEIGIQFISFSALSADTSSTLQHACILHHSICTSHPPSPSQVLLHSSLFLTHTLSHSFTFMHFIPSLCHYVLTLGLSARHPSAVRPSTHTHSLPKYTHPPSRTHPHFNADAQTHTHMLKHALQPQALQ